MNNLIPIFRANLLVFLVWVCFAVGYGQDNRPNSNALPVSTPEAEGMSSAGILKFLNAADNGKNELHSFVIVRHGKIVSEGWWKPYASDLRHVMYSVSKSFTSTGVGLAIAENKLKLTDKVMSFFPESIPDTLSSYMKGMTVQDLLKMSTGMNTDPLFNARSSNDWPKAFMSSPVEHKPGTVFKYNNMASFMLSAIVQKATGEKLLDYLKPRLFDPLGIKNIVWDETPAGYTFGAIGLKIGSEDMAKFGQMLLQKGKWKGKQIVPQSWVEEATSSQISNEDPNNTVPKELSDWQQGYGYQFWRGRNNTYRADGLGGQFIIVIPEKDAVVVLTAAAANTQEEMNLVWDNLLPAMQEKRIPVDKKVSDELAKRIAGLSCSTASNAASSAFQKKISGKKIEVAQNELGIGELSIAIDEKTARVLITRSEGKYEFTAGLNTWKLSPTKLSPLWAPPRSAQQPSIQIAATYFWVDPATLEITTRFVDESIRSESLILRFEERGPQIEVHIEQKTFVEFRGVTSRTLKGKIVN
ncbi:MAG TPA: serine hydrolase [Cyclobacteriaceae bacterium]|nr:serine hydrolase [Cyclobacteriaceae bacterium]